MTEQQRAQLVSDHRVKHGLVPWPRYLKERNGVRAAWELKNGKTPEMDPDLALPPGSVPPGGHASASDSRMQLRVSEVVYLAVWVGGCF